MLCLRGGLSPTLTKRLVGALAVDGKWSYKLHSIPHVPKGSGSFKASAGGSSHLSTILAIGASGGNPTVTAQSTDCSLHLSVKTSGSLFSWLYNLIIKAFQGTINHQICSAAKEGVNNVIQTTLTKALKQLNLNIAVPLPKALQRPGFALAVDLRLTSNPTVTSSSIAVPIRAECRNTAKPGPSTVAPALPTFGGHLSSSYFHHIRLNTSFPASNDTPRALQPRRVPICFLPRCDLSENVGVCKSMLCTHCMFLFGAQVATWSGERALSVFQHAGFLQYTVSPSIVPSSAPFSLNTNFFKVFAPDMYKEFPDRPVTVLVNVTSDPKLDFTGGRATITADASFAFTVDDNATRPATSRSAFTLACTLGVGVNISMVRFSSDSLSTQPLRSVFAAIDCRKRFIQHIHCHNDDYPS